MLSCGFVCLKHCPCLSGLFNLKPQSYKLGFTFADAYIFAGNVACVSRLRLSQQRLLQVYELSREVTDDFTLLILSLIHI